MLRCPSCLLLLWEPVTVSCGHSFCKPCLGGAVPSRCPLCQERLKLLGVGAARCNVVLCGLLEKCVERESRLAWLAARVRDRLSRGDAREALRMAQKGVELAPDSSSLRLCRAEAFAALGQHPQALEDLDAVCRAEPGQHESFFRKGKVLLEMGQRAEALLAWEHCLTLSPHFHPARREMEKILMQKDAPQPRMAAACLGDAHWGSSGPQVDGGSPALPSSSAQAQDQEGEPVDGRGDAGSEHGQGTATLSEPGRQQEPETSAERQGQWLVDNEEETAAAKCTQLCLGELLSISDLECSLCIRMFFEPVTTPCGHTFCKECLERCLDHRPNCPLCKQSLREYLKAGSYSPTVLLQDIMLATFPAQLAERRELHRAEMAELSNLTKNIPIFVCTMSFPGIACPLHVFEPRYRLMIRRCQETGTRRFGMCIYENGKSFADYGCMLEIRQIEPLPDGRSLVDTIGRRRFRVLSRGHRDGYNTADIEYLEDKKVAGEELQELQCLHESTYRLAQRFCEHGDLASRHIFMQHGPLPEKEEDIQASADGPTWCWWLISILPLDPSYQLNLFSTTSLRARLTQLQRILAALLQQPPARHPLPERSPRGRV
ncbi:LOW QUALITY PROTEIN: LON peptidase N-terminal domain and RING finger protein 1-like [Harpia harpyja]|uniref:LOW QUALITY PROTEIN: LON peptidase N-terminal domain and RING finger protein 1-like n=1 Tax=Harpia harpyja TaxID=202280 RepID=UPI0022B1566A|nr:LOW QUALITY PROTEIN: LON peptidase N-terminal domain and RING finger protein 1-like [Harpia harpyja]